MTDYAAAPPLSSDPTLGDVLRDLWRARFFVFTGAVLGLLASVIFLWAAVPQYKATMLVAPTTRSGTPDISALFPGNASFAMEYLAQSFGPGDSSDFMRFESILREASIATVLLKDPKIPEGISEAQRFRFLLTLPPDSPQEMAAWMQKHIKIDPVGATRLRRVSVRHPDPAFGVTLLNAMYDAADELIRAEIVEKTGRRVAWLRRTLEATSHPEHRRILTKLLMDQEQISMVLAVGEPYAALLAEPPYTAARPVWPRRPLIIAAFVIVGLVLGYAAHGLRAKR